ncbi:phosphate ABC transporter permease subunit PstC [Geobacillus zalihae]|uniref:phosphate ABC transporter permease subunit PstC n=1 Tax=Geobacillus zalihae TaxID=213419 RepID=UPI0037BF9EC1
MQQMHTKRRNRWLEEYIGRTFAVICGWLIVLITVTMIIFLAVKGIQSFTDSGLSLSDMLLSMQWDPNGTPPKYGALIFIVASMLVSLGALLISAPIALALAIFMNFIAPKWFVSLLKPVLELLVGIPSVVYGWLGVTILVPLLREWFGGSGFSLLAGIIVLSMMILPTITSIAADALANVPMTYMEASYGLGSTRWQAISRVIVPAAKAGIATGVVLGLARAFGEALAVQMVIGNTIKLPSGLDSPTATLTSVLTMDMANTINGTPWNNALWTLALILLLISFFFIAVIRLVGPRKER